MKIRLAILGIVGTAFILASVAGVAEQLTTVLTDAQEMMVKKIVADRLPHSAAAKFRKLKAFEGELVIAVCGEVNAKNGIGGYIGYRPFLAVVYKTSKTGQLLKLAVKESEIYGVQKHCASYGLAEEPQGPTPPDAREKREDRIIPQE